MCTIHICTYICRVGGGTYKCVRQPTRISLFRDRVMRRKSHIWSLLYQSTSIMREIYIYKEPELILNKRKTIRRKKCRNWQYCLYFYSYNEIVFDCHKQNLSFIIFVNIYAIYIYQKNHTYFIVNNDRIIQRFDKFSSLSDVWD